MGRMEGATLTTILVLGFLPCWAIQARPEESPVLEMTSRENPEELRRVIRSGAPLDGFNQSGETALHIAADKGNLELVHILVEAGATVDIKDRFGWTPFMVAASNGFFPVVQYLHEKGADLNAGEAEGISSLMWACAGNHVNIIKYLIRNGADINARDIHGRTALDFIKFSSYRSTVRLLRQLGAKEGSTRRPGSSIAGTSLEKKRDLALGLDDQKNGKAPPEHQPGTLYFSKEENPKVLEAYQLAHAQVQAGHFQEAIQYLEEANRLAEGTCEPCLNKLFHFLLKSKNYSRAESVLAQYRDISTDDLLLADSYTHMGDALMSILPQESNLLERAENYYLRALEVSAGAFHPPYLSLARLYQEINRPEKAVSLLETLLSKNPTDEEADIAQAKLSVLKVQAGARAGKLPIQSLDGGNLDLSQYRGKVVLIDVYASWCPPCKSSQPTMKRYSKKARKAPFVLIGISGDHNLDLARAYVAKNQLNWPQFIDPHLRTCRQIFGATRYPTFILLDHEGKVVYQKSGWSTTVEKALGHFFQKAIRKAKRSTRKETP